MLNVTVYLCYHWVVNERLNSSYWNAVIATQHLRH